MFWVGNTEKTNSEKPNTEKTNTEKTNSEKTSKTPDFFKAWEKLSDSEQEAFIEFYGDKLLTLLQKQEK